MRDPELARLRKEAAGACGHRRVGQVRKRRSAHQQRRRQRHDHRQLVGGHGPRVMRRRGRMHRPGRGGPIKPRQCRGPLAVGRARAARISPGGHHLRQACPAACPAVAAGAGAQARAPIATAAAAAAAEFRVSVGQRRRPQRCRRRPQDSADQGGLLRVLHGHPRLQGRVLSTGEPHRRWRGRMSPQERRPR